MVMVLGSLRYAIFACSARCIALGSYFQGKSGGKRTLPRAAGGVQGAQGAGRGRRPRGARARAARCGGRRPRTRPRSPGRHRPAAPAVGAPPRRPRLPVAADRAWPSCRPRSCSRTPPSSAPAQGRPGPARRAGDGRAGRAAASSASPGDADSPDRSPRGWSRRPRCCTARATCRSTCSPTAEGEAAWDWVRWLPHARPAFGQDAVALLGTDADSLGRRVAELQALVDRAAGPARPRPGRAGEPDVLVVLDGARRLRSLPGVVQLLKQGPAVGVYAICLDAEERLLPEECHAVVVADRAGPGLAAPAARATSSRTCWSTWCRAAGSQRVARALAPCATSPTTAATPRCRPRPGLLDVLGTRAADVRRGPPDLDDARPHHPGRRRRLARRPVRDRPPPRRPARPGRRHHRRPASPSCCRPSSPRSRWSTGRTR